MDSICLQPLFLRILYISGRILNILKFAIPIILIIKIVVDIYKHVINPEEKDGLDKIKNKVIAAIVVFLTPTIIGALYSLIENKIVNYEYSDLTLCREFANMEYINDMENEMEEILKTAADSKSDENLSNRERYVNAIRRYEAAKKENDSDSNNNSGSNSNGNSNNGNNTNASGNLQTKKYNNWNYYLYVPDSAKTSSKPLVVFLHGSGERGNNIKLLENYGFAKYITTNGAAYNNFILIPQLSSGEDWDTDANRKKLINLINQEANANNIDKSRISIAGFSLGSAPLPNLVYENQNYFSAVVFLASCTSGGGKINSFKNIPTRLYHGSNDTTNCKPSNSKSFADALKKSGGNVEYIPLSGKTHNIVDDVFKDGSVLNWMISQKN